MKFNIQEHTQFTDIILRISKDNGMPVKAYCFWPNFVDYDWFVTEYLKLPTTKEKITFIMGEHDKVMELVKKYSLEKLHSSVNELFDGHLSDYFFK